MPMIEVKPGVTAVVRPEEGANVGLIRTTEGVVVIDTTSWPSDMGAILAEARIETEEVRRVIITHYHSDHIGGNQIFRCPILSHRLTRERMAACIAGPWSQESWAAYLDELEATDYDTACELRDQVAGLRYTLPSETFEERRDLEIGGVPIEVIHLGAHTAGSSIVWLPEVKVLFAGDLIFEGRYPYLGDADTPAWAVALRRLLAFDAEMIVPGHGVLCGATEVEALADYLEAAWDYVAAHVAQGHSKEETIEAALSDPAYPRYVEGQEERLAQNVEWIYDQMM